MLHVHHRGVGVAGVYPREVAEMKVQKTVQLARSHDFPLECTMEPE
jgi:ATP-dependent Clp protease adaptor protein ClpS